MSIRATKSNLHWNYFIALEHDLEVASRYVEFAPQNFEVYSIEFAHLLFAAASEVDVIAKLLCARLQPTMPHRNIDDYRDVLTRDCADIVTAAVYLPRYGLELKPWDNWSGTTNPLWWRSYNNVKHARDTYFGEARIRFAEDAAGSKELCASTASAPTPGREAGRLRRMAAAYAPRSGDSHHGGAPTHGA